MSGPLNFVEIAPGTALRLKDGRIVVVVENPADGSWLFCRPVDGEGEEPIYVGDVLEAEVQT